ncbi:MAG: 1,4-dihydroxy-2-naphthoate polyprenyltransferase [Anaerolinea sp.]|nr:1,4-dihydroxy-2-naphthoate polyprenyltransferase [Anaerolinea sp.]
MSAAAAGRPLSRARAWKLAVRPPTLTAAMSPVFVGTAVAISQGEFRALPALAALSGALFLQVGANFANDVFDFKRGADTADRLGPPRATQMGLLSPTEMLLGMWAMLGLALVCGVYLAFAGGWPVVVFGLASLAAAVVYTGGPWPIGYHALGDLFTFVFFGLVAVVGTYYVQAKETTLLAWLAAVPVGCTVTAILVVNNLRDIDTDRATGKRTLAVVTGRGATRGWFVVLCAAAYAVALGTMVAGASPAVILVLLSLPAARGPIQAIRGDTRGAALNPVLKATARFHLVFGVLFAAGLAFS